MGLPTRAELRRQQFDAMEMAQISYKYIGAIARNNRREGKPVPAFFEHEAYTVLTMIEDCLRTGKRWPGKLKKMAEYAEREYSEHPETTWNRRVDN